MQTQTPLQSMQKPPKRKRRRNLVIGLIVLVIVIIDIASTAHGGNNPQASSTPTVQATSQATTQPTPQVAHYPPTTQADLRGLAALGDASAIHEFHSESTGLVGACPQPKREVTVSPSLTGKQLAEGLLAYFYGQQLDSPCGSLVLVYHNQSESADAYTAGRILFDVTDSSGRSNLDPHATNLKYTLTLDIGDALNGQEYVVNY